MQATRSFTVVDGAVGPIVYRFNAATVEALGNQLASLNLEARCALNAAKAAWGGCVAGFPDVALVVMPGDHAVVFAEYVEA